ncbi:MAG TPA: peptidoglycan bridge formation glycyltransferase FemA/FemB family protein [Candidatus Dormibacteraeota bacterium]|nr:peptidoglycan bridge formation glycyltransferase FemA/FemB family protein [Candidatus Dormibacteraeota bacterium]
MSEASPALSSGEALGQEEWDRLLLEQPEGNLLQSWTWGTLQSRFGWSIERLLFLEGRAGLCSLQRGRGTLPGGAIYYAPRGPVVSRPERVEALDALEQHARRGRALVLRVEPNALVGDEWPAVLEGRGYLHGRAVQPEATRLLPISGSPESLRAAFKPKTRYNLSLAERKGVTVERSRDVVAFARMADDTARRQGIHLPGVAFYQACLELFEPLDQVRLYLAHHEGDALGGIMVFRFGRTAYYLYGGSTDLKRELMPNYLLHWQAIIDFRELGCEVYDWWGIPEEPAPDHPWFGLYRFKTGFGGETVRYLGLYERQLRPAALRLDRGLTQLKTRIRRSILR